jgi:hypothetical protein
VVGDGSILEIPERVHHVVRAIDGPKLLERYPLGMPIQQCNVRPAIVNCWPGVAIRVFGLIAAGVQNPVPIRVVSHRLELDTSVRAFHVAYQ